MTTERVVTECAGRIDPSNPRTLVFDIADYQIFSEECPVVTLAYGGDPERIAVVVWNLEPEQENEYHYHPKTEHLHIILAGEAEYSLGDLAPVLVKPGQAVMVPSGVPHGIRNVGELRCSYVAITSPGPYEKVVVAREGPAEC